MSSVLKTIAGLAEDNALTFSMIRSANPPLYYYVKDHYKRLRNELREKHGVLLYKDSHFPQDLEELEVHFKINYGGEINLSQIRAEEPETYEKYMRLTEGIDRNEWFTQKGMRLFYNRHVSLTQIIDTLEEITEGNTKVIRVLKKDNFWWSLWRRARKKGCSIQELIASLGYRYEPICTLREEIAEYKKQGFGYKRIADIYGVQKVTIQKAYQKYLDEKREGERCD